MGAKALSISFRRSSDANEAVCKPFAYGELRLRNRRRAALRGRASRPAAACASARWRSAPAAREVVLRGEAVALAQKELALLTALAAEPTRVFTKEELLATCGASARCGLTNNEPLDQSKRRCRPA
jgi:DNA-binding response OmpR family regulator